MGVEFNSASLIFTGIIEFKDWGDDVPWPYKVSSYGKDNSHYLNSKYFDNWLSSVFSDTYDNHYTVDLNEGNTIEVNLEVASKDYQVPISAIEIVRFTKGLGVFYVKCKIQKEYLSFKDITLISRGFRSVSKNRNKDSYSVQDLIQQYVVSPFNLEYYTWKKNNSVLKTSILIDLNEELISSHLDNVLYELATFSDLQNDPFFLRASKSYIDEILDNNLISVFDSWKAIVLNDSLVKISTKLDQFDSFRMWENEYNFVFSHILFVRYYLQFINKKLADHTLSNKEYLKLHKDFNDFTNKFQYSNISYKFLPNTLYQKYSKVLCIDREINIVDKKLERISLAVKETSDQKMSSILLFLTLITLISVSHDFGQYISNFYDLTNINKVHLIGGVSLFSVSGILILMLWFRRK